MAMIKIDKRLVSKPIPSGIQVQEEEGFYLIDIETRVSVADLIDKEILVVTQPIVAVINGCTEDLDQILESGDEVRLLPQIAGGIR